MGERFYNDAEDCQWLRETALRGYTAELPAFESFTLTGNEDCPLTITLYTSKDPEVTEQPAAVYTLAEVGHGSTLSEYRRQ